MDRTTMRLTGAAVRETLTQHGRDSSDKWVRFIIKSYCGGTRVEVDAFGQPINRWRRKFFASETSLTSTRHAA